MLHIYYADALTDREKFIFDHIDPRQKTLLLVPDQFSLQAEEDALHYCGPSLMDLMVTDFSALGHKVVRETEGHEPRIIDKYGRHMLLSLLIERLRDDLVVLRSRGKGNSNALADRMNSMISEMKRYEVGPQRLEETIGKLKEEEAGQRGGAGSYLTLKLEDMARIYRAYEESIEGVYQDAEDYITYYADRIPRSEIVRGSKVWIYGFDTFTPKNLLVIRRLLETADEVSVVLTCEEEALETTAPLRALTQGGGEGLFRLTEGVMKRLEKTARLVEEETGGPKETAGQMEKGDSRLREEKAGRPEKDAGGSFLREKIEGYPRRTLWDEKEEAVADRIFLAQTRGSYEEAESAAAFIQGLVRDEGYRYGQIAVLCNDMEGRGRQLQRVFDRWEIPAFADQKRRVLHQPVVGFLLSFLDVLVEGLGGSGLMGMIKSGLMGWDPEDEALLENYVREFRVRGSRWQREFIWDGGVYTDSDLARLNEMRAGLVAMCEQARDRIGRHNTAGEKISGLADFLQDRFGILDRIRQTVDRQRDLDLMEGAAETAQIWNAVCGIFDQIRQVIGEEKISNALLRDMIDAGLQTLEIGLVPASKDCVLMGTLQRSRPGRIRALVVVGANAGLLPMDITDDGLLSRREKQKLESMDLEFAGRERTSQMEEQLAIYRMFSLPSDRLYVSCSQSGDDGSMLRPSEVFLRLTRWQERIEGDLGDRDFIDRIGSDRATVPYLAEVLREEEDLSPQWQQVLTWYGENDPSQISRLMRGARFDNHAEALGDELADALYRGDRESLEVSASRLEKYSGCPFAHFIQYGLRAQEQRLFEVGGREIGDVYHRCMMEFSRSLEAATLAAGDREEDAAEETATDGAGGPEAGNPGAGGEKAPAAGGPATWQTITREECLERVARILKGNAEDYREGIFSSDGYSQFRMERITEICGDIAWALVEQVRRGRIRRMYFEEPFGRRPGEAGQGPDGEAGTEVLDLPPIEITAGDRKVRIRGVIDRLDVLDTGEDQADAIRIVDYKTGSNQIRPEDFETGYRLQLMVYMDAALRTAGGTNTEDESRGPEGESRPAGVFYFKIRDFNIDGDDSAGVPDPEDPSDLESRMKKYYRMEGIVINDASLIGAMDEEVDGSVKAESRVIPVKYDPKKECYVKTGGGTLMGNEDFHRLLEETGRQAQRICEEICRGEISAIPKREKRTDRSGGRVTACKYCGFRSICGFDPSIRGCRYEDLP